MSSQLRDQHSEYTSHPMSQVAAQILDLNPSSSLSPIDTHESNAVLNIPAVLSATLPSELGMKLADLAQAMSAPLSDFLLAALTAFLARYTGQDVIHFGIISPYISQQAQAETHPPTIEMDLADAPSVPQLMERMRPHRPAIVASQTLKPSADLVSVSDQAITLQYHYRILDQSDRTTQYRRSFDGILELRMLDRETHAQISWSYYLGRLESAMIARVHGYFQTMLAAIAQSPDQVMSRLPLLTVAEQHRLVHEWNATTVAFPDTVCIHELVELQVQRQPDAPAVTYGNVTLSYQQLDARANQLAHYLQRLGVGPESLVGISADRTPEFIVGLLGVLKAGGAYVPLDASYPLERLRFMIADAQMPVILYHGSAELKVQLSASESTSLDTKQMPTFVDLDQDWLQIAKERDTAPAHQVTADNLAYVIYTSGSTGKPKGVLLEHRGLVNLVLGQIDAFALTEQSRMLQFASFSFDASVSEIFTTLVAGGQLFLAQRETLIAPDELHDVLRTHAISCVTLPPSLLAILSPHGLPDLETVITAGESCSWEIAQRWMVGHRFLNAYGPTEATIGPTVYAVAQVIPGTYTVPIGRPLQNVELFILDRYGAPAPIGMPGELYIGGAGLARGYLNRPELTAERFVMWSPDGAYLLPDQAPQSEHPIRLYRTGDLVRYLQDGNIEFLGRIDHQVKMRGLRIELGEIESTLREYPAIQDAIVLTNEEPYGNTRLVAYATIAEEAPVELWPSVAEYFVYDDLLYHAMTHDERRNQSYRVALEQTVVGKIALDVGTGQDAILARLAIEAGAQKVYAIELLEQSYLRAKATVEQLGLQDRIILIHGDVRTVELPELVDVCVSEIVGAIGGSEGASMLINEAQRFLKPTGVMIPSRSTTHIAAVSLPKSLIDEPSFTPVSGHYVEQIFAQRGYKFDLRLCLRHTHYSDLSSTFGIFEDLDFSAQTNPEYDRDEQLTITKTGSIDGFLVWLNLTTMPGEVIDILAHEHCWLPVYLPVFTDGASVTEGDRIDLQIRSRLCENGLNPDYYISGVLHRQSAEPIPFEYSSYHYKPVYQQSPFYQRIFADDRISAQPNNPSHVTPASLREYLGQRLPSYMIPSAFVLLKAFPLTPNGKIDRRALPALERIADHQDETIQEPHTPDEIAVSAIWAKALGVARIGINDDFFALGGHSLLAAQAIMQTNAELQRNISLRTLFEHPTIAEFVQAIQNAAPVQTTVASLDLAARVVLDPAITAHEGAEADLSVAPRALLLTGATGFLGAFLLEQLLRQSEATIYCIVRAENSKAAQERLVQTLREYQIWNEALSHRIVAVVGDLRLPRLGLSVELFEQLASTIDCIYHSGAQVHYLSSYTALEPANVSGTVEVLRLAAQGRIKPVHYISSIAVAMSDDPAADVSEDAPLLACTSASGYVQSKWVAEGVLRLARDRGIPVTIYRPSRICGHSQTGAVNTDDFFLRLLAGCIQLGVAPSIPISENLIPIDYAAQAIVHLSLQPVSRNRTFHIANPRMVDWHWVISQAQAYGYELQMVAYRDWYEDLSRVVPRRPDHALHSLRFLIPEDPRDAEWILAWSDKMCVMPNTQGGLSGSEIECPIIDSTLLHRMLSDGIARGLFPFPTIRHSVDILDTLQLTAA